MSVSSRDRSEHVGTQIQETGARRIAFGAAPVPYPGMASSAGTLWGSLAVLWGVVFVATTELTRDEAVPSPLGLWRANRARGAGE